MKKTVKKFAALAAAFAVIAGGCPSLFTNIPAVFASEDQNSDKNEFDKNSALKLNIEYKNKTLEMNWDKVNGAKTYLVYYYDFDYEDYVLLAITDETSFSQAYSYYDDTMFFKVCAKGYTDGKQALSKFSEEFMVCSTDNDEIIIEKKSVSDYLKENRRKYDNYGGYGKGGEIIEDFEYETTMAAAPAGEISDEAADFEYEEWEEPAEAIADAPDPAAGDDDEDDSYDPQYYYEGNYADIKPGTLTAGELKDNISRTEFERAMHGDFAEYAKKWDFRPEDRYEVHVNANGKNAENYTAELISADGKVIFAAKTNNKGTAYLFGKTELQGSSAALLRVTTADGKHFADRPLKDINTSFVDFTMVTYDEEPAEEKALDVMLVVDTTGSMSDELSYIQEELKDVITRISKDNPKTDTRVSVNFYRDNSDAYTVRPFDFTGNIDAAVRDIGVQSATGGGDYPEAVLQALDNAVNCHDWRENSTKLMFLVLDAPPHDYDRVISVWGKLIKEASANGIRIIPVTASSTDEETEYLMRSAAVVTGGTYVFLTDDSGVGNPHKKPTDSQYKVEKLNDLMVRVINSYIE